MANFCGKCGSRLNEKTGLCPRCDAEKFLSKKELRKKRKADKRSQWTWGKRIRVFFLKLLLIMVAFIFLLIGALGALNYFEIVDVPFLSTIMVDLGIKSTSNILEEVNKECIKIKAKEVLMSTETEGQAEVLIQIPDYTKLYKEAVKTEDPDKYLTHVLRSGEFDILEFQETVLVTVENGKEIFHTEEVVKKLIETELINAINALGEENF